MTNSRFYDHMTDYANSLINEDNEILKIINNDNINSLVKHFEILSSFLYGDMERDKIMQEGRNELENKMRNMED